MVSNRLRDARVISQPGCATKNAAVEDAGHAVVATGRRALRLPS